MLARLGLEVLAFEPSPMLAALAMDRLSNGDDIARSVTLVEGPVETLAEPFRVDLILLRSVLMLLDDTKREVTLEIARRHAAPGARLIVDVRTAALAWADEGGAEEERRLGHTLFRRHTNYSREADGTTRVQWRIEAERFGRTYDVAAETFRVRADTADGLRHLLERFGFEIKQLYSGYDLDRSYASESAMIVAVAEMY